MTMMIMAMLKTVFPLVLCLTSFIHLSNCKLEVLRVSNKFIDNHFYSTYDYFTNPERSKEFCKTRGAICQDNCKQCKCYNPWNTFISYQHGCLQIKDSKLVLNCKYRSSS